MWLLPLHHFIALSKFRPHHELLREGKLARYDPSMRAVFFFSHRKFATCMIEMFQLAVSFSLTLQHLDACFVPYSEWTSFDLLDPTGEQLRCMQRQILKMLEGSAADVEPTFQDQMYLPKGGSVSGAEWKRLINAGHVYIWLDFSCVPVSEVSFPPYNRTRRRLTFAKSFHHVFSANWAVQWQRFC